MKGSRSEFLLESGEQEEEADTRHKKKKKQTRCAWYGVLAFVLAVGITFSLVWITTRSDATANKNTTAPTRAGSTPTPPPPFPTPVSIPTPTTPVPVPTPTPIATSIAITFPLSMCFDDGVCVSDMSNFLASDNWRNNNLCTLGGCAPLSTSTAAADATQNNFTFGFMHVQPCQVSGSDSPGSCLSMGEDLQKASFNFHQYDQAHQHDAAAVIAYVNAAWMGYSRSLQQNWRGRNIPAFLRQPMQLLSSGLNLLAADPLMQRGATRTVYRGVSSNPANCTLAQKKLAATTATTATTSTTAAAAAGVVQNVTQLLSRIDIFWLFQSTSQSVDMAHDWGRGSLQIMRPLVSTFIGPTLGRMQLEQVMRAGTVWKSIACETASYTRCVKGKGGCKQEEESRLYMYEIDAENGEKTVSEEQALLAEMQADLIESRSVCWPSLCSCSILCDGTCEPPPPAGQNDGLLPVLNSQCSYS